MKIKLLTLLLFAAVPASEVEPESVHEVDAGTIVKAAVDHWRGLSSYSEMTMIIHRPDWERSMTMIGWTKDSDKSLIRVTEPRKDRGNGTLTDGDNMWSFSPKVNRVIKIPSSMMGQSWMGSDFSNKDLARADDIIDEYDHTLLETIETDDVTIYVIESVPHEDAAVVWGKEVLKVRSDFVIAEHAFFDQDLELVKTLTSLEIEEMGGRMVASRQRMTKEEEPEDWTEIVVLEVEYEVDLKDSMFTLSNLRNPRD